MKIYLASPFFNEKELENVKIAEKILTERGFSLFSPRLNEVRTDEITQQSWWSKETFMNDKKFIDWADVVVMLYYGGYSDSGTAWECGYAYAKGKPVHQLLYGFDKEKVFSLMMVNGCSSWDFMENFIFDRNDDFPIEQK